MYLKWDGRITSCNRHAMASFCRHQLYPSERGRGASQHLSRHRGRSASAFAIHFTTTLNHTTRGENPSQVDWLPAIRGVHCTYTSSFTCFICSLLPQLLISPFLLFYMNTFPKLLNICSFREKKISCFRKSFFKFFK